MSNAVPDLDARYAAAREIAWAAAERGLLYYRDRERLQVEHKGSDPLDVVSIADRALEDFIRAELAARFPEDGLLGEEGGGDGLDARLLWVIDPIDGTACFLNGLHNWCVSIGLMLDGVPVLGAIADPNHGELFHARRGQGAYVGDKRLQAHVARKVSDGLLGLGTTHRRGIENFLPFVTRLLEAGGLFFRNGSGALMCAYVAAGRLIGYYETHLKSWDCMAGLVLLEESGARVNDFLRNDGLLQGNPFLAAAPGVYEQLAQMVGPSLDQD